MSVDPSAIRAQAEDWFDDHGLPYFVDRRHDSVVDAISRGRIVMGLLLVALVAAGIGVLVGVGFTDISTGIWVGLGVLAAVVIVYAALALDFAPIFWWAVRYTFGSLRLLVPLGVRALPVLMLSIVFLFINNEVWQVCSNLSRTLLWSAVLFFAGIAVAFLLVRLPDEMRRVVREASADDVRACVGTPVEGVVPTSVSPTHISEVSTLRRANLVLIMLFSQAIQVLMLALIVCVFFLGFGELVVTKATAKTWIGHDPDPLPHLSWLPVSNELFQVSVFLSAFTGLYFTVYAVTDPEYRSNFFEAIAAELRTAVAVSAVYRALATEGSLIQARNDDRPAGPRPTVD